MHVRENGKWHSLAQSIDCAGYAIIDQLLDLSTIDRVLAAIAASGAFKSERNGQVYGRRNLLDISEVREIAELPDIRAAVETILSGSARAVRGVFFDKTPGANWPLPWHQDLTVALRERHDIAGWQGWSVKGGVVHAQPPTKILEEMVTVRLHLDECDSDNGPLRVLPETHRLGRLSRERINVLVNETNECICTALRGSTLFMRPLLLHASSPARHPNHRRVLQLEFAREGILPTSLSWAVN